MADRAGPPPVKRPRFGHIAADQYLSDDPSFCIFQVFFPDALATELFYTGALRQNNTHTFICQFDLEIDGTFVKGSLPEENHDVDR
jgi:hypothetical protein